MRTETEILSDIESLSADCTNLQSIAPPLSGVNANLQLLTQKLLDAYKELADARSGLPEPELAGAVTSAGPTWSKKKK